MLSWLSWELSLQLQWYENHVLTAPIVATKDFAHQRKFRLPWQLWHALPVPDSRWARPAWQLACGMTRCLQQNKYLEEMS